MVLNDIGSIITWTRQIKNVLKFEPENAYKEGKDPNPLTELEFWRKKSEDLDSISQQLQSERVITILEFLQQQKSTYINAFTKLQVEVHQARLEANDNHKFLATLKPYIQDLLNKNKDFSDLNDTFLPLMHTIYLIWQHSKFYNTSNRLGVLIREICNAIITRGQEFLNAQTIFQLIEEGEAREAYTRMQVEIDICTKFRDLYFEYKTKANEEWKTPVNKLFQRLDTFIERCQDILFLINSYIQFSSLERVEIGGTKGKHLSESVEQINSEFKEAANHFEKVDYEIMDISAKKFDDDFVA